MGVRSFAICSRRAGPRRCSPAIRAALASGVVSGDWVRMWCCLPGREQSPLLDPGKAVAVPWSIADIRMDDPAPQDAFASPTGFLQHAGGSNILDIANRPHAVNLRLI